MAHTALAYRRAVKCFKITSRDDREWIFTLPIPPILMQLIPIPSHSHSQEICSWLPPWLGE